MNTSVEYLESLGAFDLDENTLDQFISLLELEQDKGAKKAAAEFLLHVVSPSVDLTEQFLQSELVRESKDLQESVEKYVSNKEFRAAQLKSSEEYSWSLLRSELLS